MEERMGANSLICEVRWERYPLVAENVHSRAWLTWQCNRGLAANTLEAYGRGLERHLLFLARKGLTIERTTRLEFGHVRDLLLPRPGASNGRRNYGDLLANTTLDSE